MLQQETPDDYVIATGITTEVREFIRKSFAYIGVEIQFSGENEEETGRIVSIDREIFAEKVGEPHLSNFILRMKNNPIAVKVDTAYYRPTEVDLLLGNPRKANEKLGWYPKYDLDGLIADMVTSDITVMKKEHFLKNGGYKTLNYFE
jgi:GDPmannose 4,6-dehydratase